MKTLICLVLGLGMLFLQGCWFVIVPIGPIVRLIQGPRMCVPADKVVGSRMKTPGGKYFTITEIIGEDNSCRNINAPILAGVKWDEEKKAEETQPTLEKTGDTPSKGDKY